MKSVFQARSAMVRSPCPAAPSSKRHFLLSLKKSVNIHAGPKVHVLNFQLSSRTRDGNFFVSRLIVFGPASAATVARRSRRNHEALVRFGQTFDMKLERDDCEPRSLQCSTNKIIFSQIGSPPFLPPPPSGFEVINQRRCFPGGWWWWCVGGGGVAA